MKAYLRTLKTCLVLSLLIFSSAVSESQYQTIFDGQDQLSPPLKLESVRGNVDSLLGLNLPVVSQQVTKVEEWWDSGISTGGVARYVVVTRWEFLNQTDARRWPFVGNVWGSRAFPGWSQTAEVGSRSQWHGPRQVLFVKGKTLVKVYVNSRETDRGYTLRVAQKIAQKIPG